MKKIILSMTAITVASLVFVLSGCELSFNTKGGNDEATQSHTAIIEVTDDAGNIIATEAVTISDEELQQGDNFFAKDTNKTTAPSGVSPDRIQQGLNNGGTSTATTAAQTDSTDKKPSDDKNNSSDKNGFFDKDEDDLPVVQDDSLVLKSSQYMIIGRVESGDGSSVPYKVARSGQKVAMYTEFEGKQLGVIILEDRIYLLSADDKMYLEVSKELLKENATDEEVLAMINGDTLDRNAKVVQTTNQSEDGVLYNVVIYETGEKDYFLGNTIIKTVAPDGGVLYYDTVSAVVPSSVFAPPADYTKQTLNESNVSEFVDVIETTAAHNHDHE
ncbi:MAG: hypothetical protein IJ025_07355 [Clostridia bacterium]|nr:hypothetical protein [Clostridia bacterium]